MYALIRILRTNQWVFKQVIHRYDQNFTQLSLAGYHNCRILGMYGKFPTLSAEHMDFVMRTLTIVFMAVTAFVLLPVSGSGQAKLVSSVIASGGNIAVSNSGNGASLSSTIGQAVISAAQLSEVSARWEGFWTPYYQPTVGVDEQDEPLSNGLQVFPNPMSYSSRITFSEVLDGDISIRVFDLIGTQVKTITTVMSIAGDQSLALSAVDDTGAQLAAGAYLCVVEGRTAAGRPYSASVRVRIVH